MEQCISLRLVCTVCTEALVVLAVDVCVPLLMLGVAESLFFEVQLEALDVITS